MARVVITSSPFFAVGHRLAGVRIDDFEIEKVFPEVQAVLLFALDGDARPADFAHTIDVKGLDGQAFLDGFAHVFRPGLRAEDSGLKRQRGRVDARIRREIGRASCRERV